MSLKNFDQANQTAVVYDQMLERLRDGKLRKVSQYAFNKHPGMLAVFIDMAQRRIEELVKNPAAYSYLKESIIGVCQIAHLHQHQRSAIVHVDFTYIVHMDTETGRFTDIIEATHRDTGDILKGLTYGYTYKR